MCMLSHCLALLTIIATPQQARKHDVNITASKACLQHLARKVRCFWPEGLRFTHKCARYKVSDPGRIVRSDQQRFVWPFNSSRSSFVHTSSTTRRLRNYTTYNSIAFPKLTYRSDLDFTDTAVPGSLGPWVPGSATYRLCIASPRDPWPIDRT
jgi:hypothetical protein